MVEHGLTSGAPASSRTGLAALCVAVVTGAAALAASQAPAGYAVPIAKSLLVAPIIEELFFRGVVQSRLRAQPGFWGWPSVSIGVTAVLFGVAHLSASSASHALAVIAPAWAIGWVYERTRSISLCIALHSASNAVWLAYWNM